jgi:RND family efflux transporter MFP subunit
MRSSERTFLVPRPAPARLAGWRRAAARSAPVAAAAAAAVALAACWHEDPGASVEPPPPGVTVARPIERDVVSYLTYTGVIEASETVELRARVQGFLEKVNFQPGQRVAQGDLLFEIDKRQYAAAVDQARAAVRAQEAALIGAENDARLARELADQRAGPEIDAIIKAARRDVVAADVARAEADLEQALLNLEYCDVRAPMDGRISRNEVDAGNLVGRGEPTLLATIVQAVPAFVTVDVNENDVLAIRRERAAAGIPEDVEPGQTAPGVWRPCKLALSDESEFTIDGRIDYVEPRMDAQTGTLRVRTRFENADELLLPGLFSRVRFAMSTRTSLLVPEAALLRDQQGRFALVVNENGVVEARRVTIGTLEAGMRAVEEGLAKDDRVIVVGVLKARPGAKVTPTMQEPAAERR